MTASAEPTFGITAERNLNLFNDDRGSKIGDEKDEIEWVLLIKEQYSNLRLYSIRSPFFFSSHSPPHAHTEQHKRSQAGGLTGPILELERYSNKTDRPTNYPQNYNILMFKLRALLCGRPFLHMGVCAHVLSGIPACAAEELFIMQTAGGGLLHVK